MAFLCGFWFYKKVNQAVNLSLYMNKAKHTRIEERL